jgi:hypothetical protein
MWPISAWTIRSYRRRYHAALLVLLGVYRYGLLSSAEQMNVEDEVARILKRSPVPYVWHRKSADWSARAAYRAVAMARLGFDTKVPGKDWAAVLPFFWKLNPAFICLAFRRFDPATEDAKSLLASSGYDTSSDKPMTKHAFDELKRRHP